MMHGFRVLYVCAAILSVMSAAAPAAAQSEDALRAFFEGKRVAVRIDMPGSSDGVDVQGDARESIDFSRYRENLKRYGTAIHAGDSVTVTLVKLKKDLIEFQLGGGGYGTFGDDTSTTVYIADAPKTDREKQLEKRVRDEDDRAVRRKLQAELDELRDRRERENKRIEAERERASSGKGGAHRGAAPARRVAVQRALQRSRARRIPARRSGGRAERVRRFRAAGCAVDAPARAHPSRRRCCRRATSHSSARA